VRRTIFVVALQYKDGNIENFNQRNIVSSETITWFYLLSDGCIIADG
jgi:hypothetical protein